MWEEYRAALKEMNEINRFGFDSLFISLKDSNEAQRASFTEICQTQRELATLLGDIIKRQDQLSQAVSCLAFAIASMNQEAVD